MKKNSFVEGTVIATFIIVIVKLIGMLYVIPFYKIVGTEGGALYSYAYNIYLIFLSISSAGLPNAVSKIISEYNTLEYESAKKRAYKIARNIITFVSVIAFLILFIFAEEIGRFIIGNLQGGNTYEDIAFVIRCVSPSVLVIPFLSITKGYLQGHKFVSKSSMSQLIEQVVRILVILLGSYLVLNVFKGTLKVAVGIAVSGAFFGGLCAYIYLRTIMHKNKEAFENDKTVKEIQISNREIAKKIIMYAIPFIIINLVTDLYNFTDQILVLRTLEHMSYSTKDVEFIASSISTWSPKICMIINSIAMGMTISIIPTIVSAKTKGNKEEVERRINQSISMVFSVSLPLAVGLSVLSKPVWTIFYNDNVYGSMILSLAVFSALLANVYMVISTILQSLNRNKQVYLVSGIGFLTNALLDVPIMLLLNYLGLNGFMGSICASIIGFSLSILIGIICLIKEDKVKFGSTFKVVGKSLIPAVLMYMVLYLVNHYLPFNEFSKIDAFIYIIIDVIIGAPVYIGLAYKLGIIDQVFGKAMINKMISKVTFGKIKLK
jgi:O-antigen/teichoic acid export membrane protein